MELIDRDEAIKAINDVLMEDVRHRVWLKLRINNLKPVDAIPIEWIEKWLSDRSSCLERTASEIHIKQIISDWEAENRRNKHGTD